MKDEHDMVMTLEEEKAARQLVTDQVDDAMLFDYDQVLDTIANSERCKKAIMDMCMLPIRPYVELTVNQHTARALYADDLIQAISDDMRAVFE